MHSLSWLASIKFRVQKDSSLCQERTPIAHCSTTKSNEFSRGVTCADDRYDQLICMKISFYKNIQIHLFIVTLSQHIALHMSILSLITLRSSSIVCHKNTWGCFLKPLEIKIEFITTKTTILIILYVGKVCFYTFFEP